MSKNSRNITEFFKPFTIPKNRIPRQDEDDEIVVASSNSSRANTRERTLSPVKKKNHSLSPRKQQHNVTSTVRRGRGRPRKDDPVSPSKLRLEAQLIEQEHSGNITSTRKSPRKSKFGMNGAHDAPPDSSGLSSVQSSLKTTPTKVRTVEAVELPPPATQSSPLMPAPTQMPAPDARSAVNTSFGSFSTLTSMSGMSSQSSSRRIVKNGIPAVTNSDSASMSASSEDELADVEDFAPRKKRRLTPPGPDSDGGFEASRTSKPTRTSTRLDQEKVKKRARESWRPLSPPPTTTYKHSLLNIAKQSAREAASEKIIAQTEAHMQAAQRVQEEQNKKTLDASQSKNIAASFAQDSDDEERMLMAMDRTDALRGEETFYFFRDAAQDRMEDELPVEELDACGLGFLRDDAARIRACTSGFLAVVASQKGLPSSLVAWIHGQIFEEAAEELCESYVAILEALVDSEQDLPEMAFSLSETHIGRTFRDAEEPTNSVREAAFPRNLSHALKMMATLAPRISPIDQACALAELILLRNDENARNDINTQLLIEKTMQAILESNTSTSDLQTVHRETTRQILHASSISRHLLSRAIASLPATTLHLHQLRHKLALHVLLDAPLDEEINTTSPSTATRLLQKMKSHPSFHISEKTDHTALHSLADLLDIAIDVGFSDFAFLPSSSKVERERVPSPTSEEENPITRSLLFSHSPAPLSPEEASFNSQVDALASQLRLMCSRIRDAGTSHLKRTEAKTALERLALRLESTVRTQPRAKKGVFELNAVGAGMLEGFLKRAGGVRGVETRDNEVSASRGNAVRSRPGIQHKVTWRDDVVGGGDVDAGADEDDDDDDDDSSM